MSRRKPESRCENCRMRNELCLCDEISTCRSQLALKTRIVILMHHREEKLTTNTGRLAALAIPNCEIRLRGLTSETLNTEGILEEERESLFLYPSEKSVPLAEYVVSNIKKPVTLIVADGSWRQASKVSKRECFLKDVQHVHLEGEQPSVYRLRRETKAQGLATFEAIARALKILEAPMGDPSIARLEALFQRMVTRTLASRGDRSSKVALQDSLDTLG